MPASIQFYHLTTTPLERVLPKFLEKAFADRSEERVEQLNQLVADYYEGK